MIAPRTPQTPSSPVPPRDAAPGSPPTPSSRATTGAEGAGALPGTLSRHGSTDCGRAASFTALLGTVLDREVAGPLSTLLEAMEGWAERPPSPAELLTAKQSATAAQAALLEDLRRLRALQHETLSEERELRTRVHNLWQNNATLEGELRTLRGELDKANRKARILERTAGRPPPSPVGRENAPEASPEDAPESQELQRQVSELTAQLAVQQSGPQRAALEAAESLSRLALVGEHQDSLVALLAATMKTQPTPLATTALSPVPSPPQSCPSRDAPASLPEFLPTRKLSSGALGSPSPAWPLSSSPTAHDPDARLAQTLSSLRRRIEVALETCAGDTSPTSRAA